jgi:hypothetical protein
VQKRIDEQKAREVSTSASMAPVIHNHVSFPNPAEYPSSLRSPFTPTTVHNIPKIATTALVPAGSPPGVEMSVEDFCSLYCSKNPAIAQTLLENNYTSTDTFRFIEIEDLKAIGLKRGDVATLQSAVERWLPNSVETATNFWN